LEWPVTARVRERVEVVPDVGVVLKPAEKEGREVETAPARGRPAATGGFEDGPPHPPRVPPPEKTEEAVLGPGAGIGYHPLAGLCRPR
jgi:hypothetical protein